MKRYFSENTLVRMYCDFWRSEHNLPITVKGIISTNGGKTDIKEWQIGNENRQSSNGKTELDAYSNIDLFKEIVGENKPDSDAVPNADGSKKDEK